MLATLDPFMKAGTSLSVRLRRWSLWGLGLVLVYAGLGFFILPPLLRHVVVQQLAQQLNREVSIERIRLNPFACSTTVQGLLIKDPDGEPFVAWDEVYVHFQITSLFGPAWGFKEITATKPYVRVQMNADQTFNFSDLLTKFSTNPAPASAAPAKPLALQITRLHIGGASAAFTDLTTRTAFRRTLGPVDITLDDFRTDPENKNPYAFNGTTDAGEQLAWSGEFSLSPLRSQGELKLGGFTLNKYAALYQDLVRFEIRGGTVALDINYRFELNASNHLATVNNSAFSLHDFKVGKPGTTNNLVEMGDLTVAGVSANLATRTATVGSVALTGGNLFLQRARDNSINVVDLARPADTATNVSGGILFLLRSVTNAVSLLLESTNQWSGLVRDVSVTHCALHWEDEVNRRPARLDLNDLSFDAKNLSNLPGTNLTAALALRWNTNGSIKAAVTAAFLPPTAEVRLDLDQIDLGSLDPYLEPKLNLFVLGSRLGLHGVVHLTSPPSGLPQVTFHGDTSLDDFHTVDGILDEDLMKWDALHFSGIDANLNPPSVSIRELLVNHAYARIVIETNQTINLLNALRLTNPAGTATQPAKEAKTRVAPAPGTSQALPQLAIGTVVISNTTVSFSDRSIQPNVNLDIEHINGRIAGLSTEELQHADLAISAQVAGVGPASITGVINPFSGTQTNRLKITVRDVDLTPTSPYAGKFAGYGIAEGKLNLDLDYELTGKRLKAANVITLDQFTWGDKVNSPEATHLPVRLGVAMLKDRNGKIVLDVPIEGSLEDPQFRIRKVVIHALVNILEKVATSPFSLLGAVFGGGGEELAFEEFAPGSTALTAGDQTKLDSLQKALNARPALGLEITGSIDPEADRRGLQQAALEQDIRTHQWNALRQNGAATNSADQILVSPEIRAHWLAQLGVERHIAPTTNRPASINIKVTAAATPAAPRLATSTGIPPQNPNPLKGSQMLRRAARPTKTAGTGGAVAQASIPMPSVALPAATLEPQLLATYPVTDADLTTLAAERARAVQAYLLQSGKLAAARLFPKNDSGASLRRQGSRAYLQFR